MKRKRVNKDNSIKEARDALFKWIIDRLDDNSKLTSGQIRSCILDYISLYK